MQKLKAAFAFTAALTANSAFANDDPAAGLAKVEASIANAERQVEAVKRSIAEHEAEHRATAPGWPCSDAEAVDMARLLKEAAMALATPLERHTKTKNCADGGCQDAPSRRNASGKSDCIDCPDRQKLS